MNITSTMNLTFPVRYVSIERPDPKNKKKTILVHEPTIWAYHTPIARTVFEANFRILAAAKSALFGKGVAYAAENAPLIAALEIRRAAEADAEELGTEDQGPALLAEITRLTQIVAPGAAGYEPLPADLAVQRKALDAEEWSEALGALCFFTCGYAMAPRVKRERIGDACAAILRGSMTSSSLTEFVASLPPLTATPTSATPSSVPS